MKKIFTFIFLTMCLVSISQTGMWVWMKGDSTNNNSIGVFGTKNIANPSNKPPGLYEACEWKDSAGNLWLFGGVDGNMNEYNSLWKYDIVSNQWTWISGANYPNALPVYGTKGVPGPNNTPGARGWGIQCWTDSVGDFWLFGGYGWDAAATQGCLNDLWRFNPITKEWTWMTGSTLKNDPGTYGTKGVSSPTVTPGARNESNCTWVYRNELWLFGGLTSTWGSLNDLWKYNILTGEWTWVWGSSATLVTMNRGIKGVPSLSNDPGGRYSYTSYSDDTGNLYFLGSGWNYPQPVYLDLWKYNIPSGIWTWVAGVDSANYRGKFSNKCNSANDLPAAKYETRACWKLKNGMYLFGGVANNCYCTGYMFYNDLWYLDMTNYSFTWINGSTNLAPYTYGLYGIQGVASSNNSPSSRMGSSSWTDNNGDLWMFGGYFWDTIGMNNYKGKNDLWKFFTDTECIKPPQPTNINQWMATNDLKIYPNPVNKNLFIDINGRNSGNVFIKIIDVLGKEILRSKLDQKVNEIDVGRLSEGIYFIEVWSLKELIYKSKIIKD